MSCNIQVERNMLTGFKCLFIDRTERRSDKSGPRANRGEILTVAESFPAKLAVSQPDVLVLIKTLDTIVHGDIHGDIHGVHGKINAQVDNKYWSRPAKRYFPNRIARRRIFRLK